MLCHHHHLFLAQRPYAVEQISNTKVCCQHRETFASWLSCRHPGNSLVYCFVCIFIHMCMQRHHFSSPELVPTQRVARKPPPPLSSSLSTASSLRTRPTSSDPHYSTLDAWLTAFVKAGQVECLLQDGVCHNSSAKDQAVGSVPHT